MNWKDIKNLIKKELKEATEVNAGGSKFNLRTGVNKNPTKLGVKIQFEPKAGILDPDVKAKLEVALQEKLNDGLSKYKFQVSKDTDVPRDEVIGFFIPHLILSLGSLYIIPLSYSGYLYSERW